MTMPIERTRALRLAGELMRDLLNVNKNPDVPDEIRKYAEVVLRHYPDGSEIEQMAYISEQDAKIMAWLAPETSKWGDMNSLPK
jgi:hypothetical protein